MKNKIVALNAAEEEMSKQLEKLREAINEWLVSRTSKDLTSSKKDEWVAMTTSFSKNGLISPDELSILQNIFQFDLYPILDKKVTPKVSIIAEYFFINIINNTGTAPCDLIAELHLTYPAHPKGMRVSIINVLAELSRNMDMSEIRLKLNANRKYISQYLVKDTDDIRSRLKSLSEIGYFKYGGGDWLSTILTGNSRAELNEVSNPEEKKEVIEIFRHILIDRIMREKDLDDGLNSIHNMIDSGAEYLSGEIIPILQQIRNYRNACTIEAEQRDKLIDLFQQIGEPLESDLEEIRNFATPVPGKTTADILLELVAITLSKTKIPDGQNVHALMRIWSQTDDANVIITSIEAFSCVYNNNAKNIDVRTYLMLHACNCDKEISCTALRSLFDLKFLTDQEFEIARAILLNPQDWILKRMQYNKDSETLRRLFHTYHYRTLIHGQSYPSGTKNYDHPEEVLIRSGILSPDEAETFLRLANDVLVTHTDKALSEFNREFYLDHYRMPKFTENPFEAGKLDNFSLMTLFCSNEDLAAMGNPIPEEYSTPIMREKILSTHKINPKYDYFSTFPGDSRFRDRIKIRWANLRWLQSLSPKTEPNS